ncbi:MAG TPA: chaperone modulator CbpM [Flavitalea sp.]|nr:chaperone modulator CbpM [Flavitalea sp.]
MKTEELIPAQEFCTHHQIDLSFIYSLTDAGLIQTIRREESVFVPVNEISNLEKLVRLYELDINVEGIETITYLLQKIDDMQQHIIRLSNQLRMYEEVTQEVL